MDKIRVDGGKIPFHVPEEYREAGIKGSNNGMFRIPNASIRNVLIVIASDRLGWEHVSVSKKYECPTWDEMCKVKALFWGPDQCVVQYHPPESAYVNLHPYCLNMWRPVNEALPMPPEYLV